MVFNEQLYKNKQRKYFHGTPYETLDKSNDRFGCFFLTTDFSYAVTYSKIEEKGIFGNVFEFHLKNPMNIFNIKSTMDRYKLQKSVSKELYELAITNNWLTYSSNVALRKDLLKAIKDLGYDGFFDKEVPPEDAYDNPTIGIFSIKNLVLVKKYLYDDFMSILAFRKRHKDEIKSLGVKCMTKYKSGIKDKELLAEIVFVDSTCTLTRQEISDFIENNLDYFKECIVEVHFNEIGEPYILLGNKVHSPVFKSERFLKLKEMGYFGGLNGNIHGFWDWIFPRLNESL